VRYEFYTSAVPTSALTSLETALGDVDNLIAHHPKSAKPGRGRPATDEGPLLRSCIVLLYAAWEVYVEDGVVWAVEQVTTGTKAVDLPPALRAFVATQTAGDPWRLADDGWRDVCVNEVITLARGDEVGSFGINTAGPHQIANLHNKILGENLLNKCRWSKKTTELIKQQLAQFVTIRGAIAHTGQPPGALHLAGVRHWQNLILRLASNLDTHLETWVNDQRSPLLSSRQD
jgi:hypothetical protein